MICSAMALLAASPAYAQGGVPPLADAEPTEVEGIVVTGSRIVRQDYVANSPIATVTGEQAVANADITLDTYLNTLPQVNPAGTTTSNNPGNNGQANIDLRGLGANRNIVLIDGRRAMVSANDLTVDVNTIPQALIQNIEVITGGAGATYGADAIAGAVNFILKKDFEGVDIRANYSNSTEYWDATEYQVSAVLGGNFADGKGNAVVAFDRSFRQSLIKSQRAFAANATSTTSFLPEGALFWQGACTSVGGCLSNPGNPISEAAVDALFATYGVAAADVVASSSALGFNMDGTLFYKGVFNSPLDAQNFKYPIDGAVNQSLYPDLYSYNFDFVNILVSPLDRYSFMSKVNYETDNGIEFFASAGWTEYTAAAALAPTPFPTVNSRHPATADSDDVVTSLVNESCDSYTAAGVFTGSAPCQVAQLLVIPVTNPFIPDDLAALLATRTGDDSRLLGTGATEPFLMRQRTLDIGLRKSTYENTVVQFMGGVRVPLGSDWELEASIQEGRTEIDEIQTGNVDTQRLQGLIEAEDGGVSECEGGFNIFGRQPISPECRAYLESTTVLSTAMKQQIAQAFVRGPMFALPAGNIETVVGAEYRSFEYDFNPGSASGPISGFTTQNPDAGSNAFYDLFGEMLIPVVRDMPFAQSMDVTLGYRYSWSEFTDAITGTKVGPRGSPSWKIDLNWGVIDPVRVRASYQRSVREPNFSELFAGGGSAPQYFDPCSVTSQFRINGGADARAICLNAGNNGGVSGAQIDTFVQTPGSQTGVDLAGNTELQPEKGETFTLGVVLQSPWESPWLNRLRASVDYYKIKIEDALLVPTPNQIVAQCYNYYGTNPDLDPDADNCFNLTRVGGDILWIYDYAHTEDGVFASTNGGRQETSGIDFQVDYGFDWEQLGLSNSMGSMRFNALLTHILEFKQQDPIEGVPELDFVGTVAYFGSGLGTSFPDWKGTFNAVWDVDPLEVGVRARYIAAMDNRLSVEFPGETEFTGPDAVWYWDVFGAYDINDNVEVRMGVNNVTDKQAEEYAPNVQSGTDPSTYDVIGRRVFAGLRLRF